MKIIITGIAGFIGSNLAERLLADGHEVVGIDNLATGAAENVPPGVTWKQADVSCDCTWRWVGLRDAEVIYHLAASYRDPKAWDRDARTNVLGTIATLRAARDFDARVVYAQTSLCYGLAPASPVRVDAPLDPRGSYAVSKTAGEAYIRDSGLPYVSLRLANIYGPRNLSGPVPAFFRRLEAGQSCTVVDSRRDFVYVGDAVDLFARAAREGSGVYHLSSGSDHSVGEVFSAVTEAMGLDIPVPLPVPRGPDDAASLLLDPARTNDAFGWRPHTPLAEGVANAVAWYREHGVRDTFTHLGSKA